MPLSREELLKENERYRDIINLAIEMFAYLDAYRKEKEPVAKQRKLFPVHSVEGQIRKKINHELALEEKRAQNQNTHAA